MEEGVVASQPQTTISSEADVSRQQRGSQEPSSEFARHVSPLDSGGDLVVAESNNQASVTAVHVDSSESLLTGTITQSVSVPSQSQGVEEGEGEGERREMEESKGAALVSIVVGVVEPERPNLPATLEEHPQTHPEPQQLQSEQKEQEQPEPLAEMIEEGEGEGERGEEEEVVEEDREAVGDVRESETTEQEEGAEEEATVMDHAEEGARVKDATREQADTTQKLEEGTYYVIIVCIVYEMIIVGGVD